MRKYLAEERAAALVYRPSSSQVVAQDAADMQRLLGAGRSERLASIPPRAVPATPERKGAELEKEEAGISVFRTAEGIPVLVRRKIGTPMASIGVYIVGGAVEDEEKEAGLTLITARTMLKGTANRSAAQIAEDSEMLGGTISAGAGSDSFGWSFSVPKARLAQALELMGDVIQRPTIPDDSFETERTVALSNVAMLRDDMYRYPMRLATSVAFGKHPYGLPTMGTEESLRAISAEQAREWHRSRVLRSAAVIGIVADLDGKETADLVAREVCALEPEKGPEIRKPSW